MADIVKQRIGQIDLVKGIAMLMVLIVHTAQVIPCPFANLASFGQMGCQIFFVFSAYTLCNSFSKQKSTYFRYISHRFMRLASGYWLAIILYVSMVYITYWVIGYNKFQQIDASPLNILVNMMLLNGLTPSSANNNLVLGGWFVGTLFLFYIVFPFIYKVYFSSKYKIWNKDRAYLFPIITFIISYILVYSFIIIFNGFASNHNSFIYFSLINQLPCIVIGISLYDTITHKEHKSLNTNYLVGGVGILIILFSYAIFMSKWRKIYPLPPFVFSCGVVFVMSCFFTLPSFWQTIKNLFISKIIEKTGLHSFGIYLLHPIITYFLIPIISPISEEVLINIIGNKNIIISVNFLLMFMIVFVASSFLTIYFNWIQSKLYSYMNNAYTSMQSV